MRGCGMSMNRGKKTSMGARTSGWLGQWRRSGLASNQDPPGCVGLRRGLQRGSKDCAVAPLLSQDGVREAAVCGGGFCCLKQGQGGHPDAAVGVLHGENDARLCDDVWLGLQHAMGGSMCQPLEAAPAAQTKATPWLHTPAWSMLGHQGSVCPHSLPSPGQRGSSG
jgi:hypothetical protein